MAESETIAKTTIAEFSIEKIQFINQQGEAVQQFPAAITDDVLIQLYHTMVLTQLFDNKTINLQRTGQMGTFAASTGQEAISVGVGYAMQQDDVYCGYYRDQGILMQRNVALDEILSYWGGDERANDYQHNPHDFPPCVPIATQCLHAAGAAFALQQRNQQQAVVTTIGDGGTSKGDFYEAVNVAGCWALPLVFVVNNNQWAISVPLKQQTACETIAQKAIAGGFSGIQVDGNDIVAVVYATQQALAKARNGDGPSLIEAMTYRLCDHTTADDAKRYQDQSGYQVATANQPIQRLKTYLISQQLWDEQKEHALQQQCSATIDNAVEIYLAKPAQKATDIVDYLYATLPVAMQEQRDQIEELN